MGVEEKESQTEMLGEGCSVILHPLQFCAGTQASQRTEADVTNVEITSVDHAGGGRMVKGID